MRQRIKKIFLLLKPKSTLFSVSLFLIIFGLLFLAIPKPAFGLFWGLVDVDLEAVPAQIFGLVLLALLKIGQGVVWAGTSILDFITEPGFISYSYTGLDNPIVKYGWTITRDLANIGIVLGLVIIALATILRIESYQAKKTLPLLIIVALLINFTPVIMGVIVDGSNILMGYFLGQRGKENPLGHSLAEPFTKAETAIGAAVNARADFPTFTVLTLLFFSIILFIILIIYSLLFLTRYLAIWILVVLSPLAFFCLIFPGTKSLFSQWWKQFINWCFIGVIAGFFLYLSSRIMTGVIRSSFPTVFIN